MHPPIMWSIQPFYWSYLIELFFCLPQFPSQHLDVKIVIKIFL